MLRTQKMREMQQVSPVAWGIPCSLLAFPKAPSFYVTSGFLGLPRNANQLSENTIRCTAWVLKKQARERYMYEYANMSAQKSESSGFTTAKRWEVEREHRECLMYFWRLWAGIDLFKCDNSMGFAGIKLRGVGGGRQGKRLTSPENRV